MSTKKATKDQVRDALDRLRGSLSSLKGCQKSEKFNELRLLRLSLAEAEEVVARGVRKSRDSGHWLAHLRSYVDVACDMVDEFDEALVGGVELGVGAEMLLFASGWRRAKEWKDSEDRMELAADFARCLVARETDDFHPAASVVLLAASGEAPRRDDFRDLVKRVALSSAFGNVVAFPVLPRK